MAIQKTYSMIKPDGVRNGHIGEIVNRFERAGLTVERMELGMVTLDQAKANYAEHEGKPFYDGLVSYITSGPVVKMVISGEGAVAKVRTLMGATNPAEAAPGTIRGISGLIMDGKCYSRLRLPGGPLSARSASSSHKPTGILQLWRPFAPLKRAKGLYLGRMLEYCSRANRHAALKIARLQAPCGCFAISEPTMP